MKTSVKIIGLVVGIIVAVAAVITLSLTVHNVYASKSEVQSVRSEMKTEIISIKGDIKYIRGKTDELYGVIMRGVCEH